MTDKEKLIQQMSTEEITKQLLFSQVFLFVLGIVISAMFMESFIGHWKSQWDFTLADGLWYGVVPAIFIIGMDLLLMKTLPETHYDDGGINRKVFEKQSIFMIVLLTAVVAISEEVLFRGVFQPMFGYVTASLLFALVHIRYLKKPVLFISVLYISFLLGFVYEQTQVLTYVVIAHFLVDVTLALLIRYNAQ